MPSMDLEEHRPRLTGYCYRLLGGGAETEDAVQETFVRAWRTHDPERGPLTPWLYRLATTICLDMLRGAQRRATAMDLSDPAAPGSPLGAPLPGSTWVGPFPDARLEPAAQAETREDVRLAFVAALQTLPPRQRAVLILRDVLCWRAAEVADLLDTTTASVNSALQRARAGLRRPEPLRPADPAAVERYTRAFVEHDVATLVRMLHEDATTTMPPFAWWLRGAADIAAVVANAPDSGCDDVRLIPTRANGQPAFGQYRRIGDEYRPFALVVVEFSADRVVSTTTCLDPDLFGLFDLPMTFPTPARTSG
ncbi:RNA polymerase subunit sigma-70 [Actinosynnema sp. NPDC020468]|uniref:RNA polymerase subunit sigma-70 n=1 Tax=Actinosynnema sp. NPDC020468 TaxID=3154488 RepID=UPI0033FE0264